MLKHTLSEFKFGDRWTRCTLYCKDPVQANPLFSGHINGLYRALGGNLAANGLFPFITIRGFTSYLTTRNVLMVLGQDTHQRRILTSDNAASAIIQFPAIFISDIVPSTIHSRHKPLRVDLKSETMQTAAAEHNLSRRCNRFYWW